MDRVFIICVDTLTEKEAAAWCIKVQQYFTDKRITNEVAMSRVSHATKCIVPRCLLTGLKESIDAALQPFSPTRDNTFRLLGQEVYIGDTR